MAILILETPTPTNTDERVELVATVDESVWRENGGNQAAEVDRAGRALLAADQPGAGEATLAPLREAFATAQAALGAALGKLELYRSMSDVSLLTVPDDATVWVMRPLSKPEAQAAHKAAGQPSVLGQRLQAELTERATEAVNRKHAGWLDPEERHRLLMRERARAVDSMLKTAPEDVEALGHYEKWRNQLRVETLRRCLVEVRNGPAGAPAEIVDRLALIVEANPFDRLVVELGEHAIRVAGGLAPAGKASSNSTSGVTTNTPAGGSASSAPSSPPCAASEATAEGPSA